MNMLITVMQTCQSSSTTKTHCCRISFDFKFWFPSHERVLLLQVSLARCYLYWFKGSQVDDGGWAMLQVEGSSWCGLSIWPLHEQHIPLEMRRDEGREKGVEQRGEYSIEDGGEDGGEE